MRMVTRTIKTSHIVTKCIDSDTMEVVDKTFTVSDIKSANPAKVVNKILKDSNSNLKLVKIVGVTSDEVRYGMPEVVFIDNAEVIE